MSDFCTPGMSAWTSIAFSFCAAQTQESVDIQDERERFAA